MALPANWHIGLTEREMRAILRCERLADAGIVKIQPKVHEKGYLRVSLPRRHPYARSGTNFLHRYYFERKIGRRLHAHEHIHHLPGEPLSSANLRRLELWEAVEHGRIGVRRRRKMARLYPLWKPRNDDGTFTSFPRDARMLEPVPF